MKDDDELVVSAIAEALAARPLPGMSARQAIAAHLANRRMLLVLDNCEHLLGPCAEAVGEILEGAPGVKVLTTSRAPLKLDGEIEWEVPPLALPEESTEVSAADLLQFDAARLFVERATQVRPNFTATEENAGVIVKICRLLDGIPFAIELAAARVRVLSLEGIAEGLSKDDTRLLKDGPRGRSQRHLTAEASMKWSHDLLSEQERMLFRRLAVFMGGWTLDAAERVCSDKEVDNLKILDLLTALFDWSLVVVEEHGSKRRYRLLEIARKYALDQLAESGEADGLRRRHREYYLALAEKAEPDLQTARQEKWLADLDVEAANFRAAIAPGREPRDARKRDTDQHDDERDREDAESALRLCAALTLWWRSRGRFVEGERLFVLALETAKKQHAVAPVLRGRALWGRAFLAGYRGEFEASREHAARALEIAEQLEDRPMIARALCAMSLSDVYLDPPGSRRGLQRAIEYAQGPGSEWTRAEASLMLALSYLFQFDPQPALEILRTNEALIEGSGYANHIARYRVLMGMAALYEGHVQQAREELELSMASAEEVGETVYSASSDFLIATIDIHTGKPEQALDRLRPRLERSIATGTGVVIPQLWNIIGFAELSLNHLEQAEVNLKLAEETTAGRYGVATGLALVLLAEAQRLGGRPEAGDTAKRAHEVATEIQARPIQGLARLVQSRLASQREDWREASEHAHAALDACEESGSRPWIPDCLDALAEVAIGLESFETAAKLLGAAEKEREELGIVRYLPEDEHWDSLSDTLREELGPKRAESLHQIGYAAPRTTVMGWVRRARGERKRPKLGWEALSPREMEIVPLVAEGLSNPAIGKRLFMAAGTVSYHLKRIYPKVGVKNRAELAAAYARRFESN